MDYDHKIGTILCDSCGAKYERNIAPIDDPIDVYADWIDKCVRTLLSSLACSAHTRALACAVRRAEAVNSAGAGTSARRETARPDEEEDDDDF